MPDAGLLDVPATHKASIDCLAWWGVSRGRTPTHYDPGGEVTRAQMATFIANALRQSGDERPRPASCRAGRPTSSGRQQRWGVEP